MKIELTEQQYRYLLDLVYIGNWVMNSTREDDRIKEYDEVESLVFSHCLQHKMSKLVELYHGELIPSRAFADGGIHEAIESYEDVVFYEILAEELALRDMDGEPSWTASTRTSLNLTSTEQITSLLTWTNNPVRERKGERNV